MAIVIIFFTAIYSFFTIFLWIGWIKIRTYQPSPTKPSTLNIAEQRFAVIIPVRNEANHIGHLLEDLNQQTLDTDFFEVWVVDDNSSDNTVEIILSFIPKSNFVIYLIALPEKRQMASAKKEAITFVIQHTLAPWIITTDGDCRVKPEWLEIFWHFFTEKNPQIVSSAVTFEDEKSIFSSLQSVEFASLVGSGAATLSWKWATMCNGANLAYTKQAFEKVKGFAGVEAVISGDDEFLFHKITHQYPLQTYFLKNPHTTVLTKSQPTLKGFFEQRKRWGSKWKYYQNKGIKLLAIGIFFANFLLLVGLGLWLGGFISTTIFITQISLKWVFEWFFLSSVLHFFGKTRQIFWIPLVQILYPFYVLLMGLSSQFSDFEWKGRKMKQD